LTGKTYHFKIVEAQAKKREKLGRLYKKLGAQAYINRKARTTNLKKLRTDIK
jgi:hypothetical protein